MKKRYSMIMISMMLISFLFSGVSMAADDWDMDDFSGSYKKGRGEHSLDRIINQKIFLESISEITPSYSKKNKDEMMEKLLSLDESQLSQLQDLLIGKYEIFIKNLALDTHSEKLKSKYQKRVNRQMTMIKLVKIGIVSETISNKDAKKILFRKFK